MVRNLGRITIFQNFDESRDNWELGWWIQGLWVPWLHQMGDGGTSFTCLIPSVYSLCFVFTMWIYYIFVQDPDHILTREGNATGSVAPNLAIWTTSVPHFHLLDLSKVLFYLTEVAASYTTSHLVVLNVDINLHSILEVMKILCYITFFIFIKPASKLHKMNL